MTRFIPGLILGMVLHNLVPGAAAAELDRVPAPLAAKAREVVAQCGSTVLSVHQGHTYHVLHTKRVSLHSIWKAVDLQGNARCIYAHLRGWLGGYSTDYGVVGHVHVSYARESREWGRRFVHGGHGRKHYAKHRSHRRA